MSSALDKLPDEERSLVRRARPPRGLDAMKAVLTDERFSHPDWIYERKLDGIRCLAFKGDRDVRLRSRNDLSLNGRFPEIAAALEADPATNLILDGEVVAFDPDTGNPSFQLLQRRMGLSKPETIKERTGRLPVTYIAFDLLWLDDRSLLAEPYEQRRELLAELELDGAHWQSPRHHVGEGQALFDAIHARGLEGIVAKRLGSPYRPGRRSQEWLKVRNRRGQELVVGGWMPGEGSRGGRVGSLLVGHWDATPQEAERLGRPPRLVYAGGVGTGFTLKALDQLTAMLAPLRRAESPFELGEDPRIKYAQRARDRGSGPVWVEPELVCHVEFTEWTHEGTLRQPSFKGLRADKDPHEVVREL